MSTANVSGDGDATRRERIGKLLSDGLQTEWRQRGYSSAEINAVVSRLQALATGDESGRLCVAGFTLKPYMAEGDDIEQSCSTCMYYEQGRQFCALPELQLPVLPQWSCRLWRI